MEKRTPTNGPWKVGKPFQPFGQNQKVHPIEWKSPNCDACGRSDGEYLVAWVFFNSIANHQKVARLIAAAPAMLQALKAIHAAPGKISPAAFGSIDDEALNKLHAAIKQAEGDL